MTEYIVYLLKSTITERYYIGCTTNIETRIHHHNQGKTKSTKPYRPWTVIYIEKFDDKKMAYKREWHLKHPQGYQEKLDIIKQHGRFA